MIGRIVPCGQQAAKKLTLGERHAVGLGQPIMLKLPKGYEEHEALLVEISDLRTRSAARTWMMKKHMLAPAKCFSHSLHILVPVRAEIVHVPTRQGNRSWCTGRIVLGR